MHCLYLEKYILMAKQIIADFCCLAFVVMQYYITIQVLAFLMPRLLFCHNPVSLRFIQMVYAAIKNYFVKIIMKQYQTLRIHSQEKLLKWIIQCCFGSSVADMSLLSMITGNKVWWNNKKSSRWIIKMKKYVVRLI